jgi:hypothetical protein
MIRSWRLGDSRNADRPAVALYLIESPPLQRLRQVDQLGLLCIQQATQFGNCDLMLCQLDAGMAVLG